MPSAGVKTRKAAGEGTGKATAGNGLKTLEALRRYAEESKAEIVLVSRRGWRKSEEQRKWKRLRMTRALVRKRSAMRPLTAKRYGILPYSCCRLLKIFFINHTFRPKAASYYTKPVITNERWLLMTEQAFVDAVHEHQAMLFRVAYTILHNHEDCADAL